MNTIDKYLDNYEVEAEGSDSIDPQESKPFYILGSMEPDIYWRAACFIWQKEEDDTAERVTTAVMTAIAHGGDPEEATGEALIDILLSNKDQFEQSVLEFYGQEHAQQFGPEDLEHDDGPIREPMHYAGLAHDRGLEGY